MRLPEKGKGISKAEAWGYLAADVLYLVTFVLTIWYRAWLMFIPLLPLTAIQLWWISRQMSDEQKGKRWASASTGGTCTAGTATTHATPVTGRHPEYTGHTTGGLMRLTSRRTGS